MRVLCLACLVALPVHLRAEYHRFNTQDKADGIMQEVRWPAWWANEYNAIYSNQNPIKGANGEQVGFYGGMPIDAKSSQSAKIIWSFWSPKATSNPNATVTAAWTGPNMYAPLHIGEGASGKVAGDCPLLTTNRWYREVMRIWPAADGTPNVGYAARWLRDPATTNWYHLATMKIPFTPVGMAAPLTGFQEGLGGLGIRRTDYRNVYYHVHDGGPWQKANQFSVQVKSDENATAGLFDNATAAFFETSKTADYLNQVLRNPPLVTGSLYLIASETASTNNLLRNLARPGTVFTQDSGWVATLTLTNQSDVPPADALVVTNYGASVNGDQLLVYWSVPMTSSPQFSYQIDVYNNANYSGTPAATFYDIDPEARQKLLTVSGVNTPYVRLTVVDVMNQTNPAIAMTAAPAILSPATNVVGAVNGLAYQYYESPSNYRVMPDFSRLTPVYQGAVNYPDLTVRRQRQQYAFNYTGYVNVPANGIYTFTLNSSDGSRLLIDGDLVVDWNGDHSPSAKNGWVGLQAGLHRVNVQYFFDEQNINAHDLSDALTVSWAGPGLHESVVPASAWYRAVPPNEPVVTLLTPGNGLSVCDSNVTFTAGVARNGVTVNRVEYHVGDHYWGSSATLPYAVNTMMWASQSNVVRVRLFYNGTNSVDSGEKVVKTTNMNLGSWAVTGIGMHLEPVGAAVVGGTSSVVGDGLNLLSQQVSGDCVVTAHLAGLTTAGGMSPDGQAPDSGWQAGIILKQNTNGTPGSPLGDKFSQYASVFERIHGGSYFEDSTMHNAGGSHPSENLGAYSWFRLQRIGDVFTSYVSKDGVAWLGVNTNTLAGIGPVLHAGVFTYAASSANPNVLLASFDNVSITSNVSKHVGSRLEPATATVGTNQPDSLQSKARHKKNRLAKVVNQS